MKSEQNIKNAVQQKYAEIAVKAAGSCCDPKPTSCCGTDVSDYSVFNDDYSKLDGYMQEADLQLGCGLPTEFAGIKKDDTVLDLGSGAGNDVFVARSLVGEKGRVVGVDMTPEMINRAELNKSKLGYHNVEFRLGEIENLPLGDAAIDVVISNCVLNLVPDKPAAFQEIFRVLKKGAHFCISDVVYQGEMTEDLRKSAEMYAGCVAGALKEAEYLQVIEAAGFKNLEIKTKKKISLPEQVLAKYISPAELQKYKAGDFGIFSITVTADK